MTTARTGVVPAVWTTLTYRDPQAALAFLTSAFGFTERAVHTDGEQLVHVELTFTGPDGTAVGGLMFGDGGDQKRIGNGCVHVVTGEPDALFERAVAGGATVVRSPEDTDYGSRQFIVLDPEDNLWSFGTWYE
jgi:uncharacterized glyoxalase superfamily protein PhnB